MIKYIKEEMKHLPFVIVVFVLLYGLNALADSYAINSTSVGFNNSGTGITSNNVQSAVMKYFYMLLIIMKLKPVLVILQW